MSDWSSDVCSSDLLGLFGLAALLVRFVGEHQRREQQLANLGAALDAAGFFVDKRRELDKLLLLPVGAMDVIGPSGDGQANVSHFLPPRSAGPARRSPPQPPPSALICRRRARPKRGRGESRGRRAPSR